MNNYVLGAGLAGLIFGYLNKSFTVIGRDLLGQMSKSKELGPRFLEKNEWTERFIKELDIPYVVKTAKIAYSYRGELHSKFTQEMLEAYAKKTGREVTENVMNGQRNSFEYLAYNQDLFCEKLIYCDNIIMANAEHIIPGKAKHLTLSDGKMFNYDNLVSTIPFNILYGITHNGDNLKFELKAQDIFFVEGTNWFGKTDIDFIYDIDEDSKIYRITNYKTKMVLESYEPFENKNSVCIKKGKILNNLALDNYYGIYLVGRYAQWDGNIKLEDVIERSYKYAETMAKTI